VSDAEIVMQSAGRFRSREAVSVGLALVESAFVEGVRVPAFRSSTVECVELME
jgi:hypothetical protein